MKYITIGRQVGSGGRDIGKAVAKQLEIPFYDKELITLASQRSGVSEGYIATLDEHGTASFFHSLTPGGVFNAISGYLNITMNDQLFLLQSDIIKELSRKGNAVFVGRCADSVLSEQKVLSVFIYAPDSFRIGEISKREGLSPDDAEALMRRIDRKRKSYYQHYTSNKWGRMENHTLCLDSSKLSQKAIADIIITAYNEM